jgi:hypothetical protein
MEINFLDGVDTKHWLDYSSTGQTIPSQSIANNNN